MTAAKFHRRSQSRTRVAIYGPGAWAKQSHLPGLRRLDAVEVTACVGRSAPNAARFARQQGIPRSFDCLEDLMNSDVRPDVLIVTAPNDRHAGAARTALEAGVAVFCEKPLAVDCRSADRLARLATAVGARSTVGYSHRYNQLIQRVADAVRRGVLGVPALVELSLMNAQFHPRRPVERHWKRDSARPGAGVLLDYGSHLIDLAWWLFGSFVAASVTIARDPESGVDSFVLTQIEFSSGARGVLAAGWSLPGGFPGLGLRVHGSDGAMEVELGRQRGVAAWRHLAVDGELVDARTFPAEEVSPMVSTARHLEDFIGQINGELPLVPDTLPTFADGAQVQNALEAISACGANADQRTG